MKRNLVLFLSVTNISLNYACELLKHIPIKTTRASINLSKKGFDKTVKSHYLRRVSWLLALLWCLAWK